MPSPRLCYASSSPTTTALEYSFRSPASPLIPLYMFKHLKSRLLAQHQPQREPAFVNVLPEASPPSLGYHQARSRHLRPRSALARPHSQIRWTVKFLRIRSPRSCHSQSITGKMRPAVCQYWCDHITFSIAVAESVYNKCLASDPFNRVAFDRLFHEVVSTPSLGHASPCSKQDQVQGSSPFEGRRACFMISSAYGQVQKKGPRAQC